MNQKDIDPYQLYPKILQDKLYNFHCAMKP